MVEGSRTSLQPSTCSCGVIFVKRRNRTTGRWNPITLHPSELGNVKVHDNGECDVIRKDEDFTGPRYLNHFSDCVDAQKYGGDKPGKPEYRKPVAPESETRQSSMDLGPNASRYTD